jgi:mevalonate kinase
VGSLRERQARWPTRYRRVFTHIAALVREGAQAVRAGELETLGDVMNMNQGLLSSLGLSSPALETMVYRLRANGALGAKLTGAGGDGGAVIGLFREPEPTLVKLRREGVDCFVSQLAGPRAL